MSLWDCARHGWAEHMWRGRYHRAVRSRRPAMCKVARMIKRHWQGVINAATTNATKATAEVSKQQLAPMGKDCRFP